MFTKSKNGKLTRKVAKPKTMLVVSRARAPALKPMAPSRMANFRPLSILSRPAILALKHRAKLLYNENVQVTTGAAATNSAHVFSANGMFDPNITGVGHQPMSFDQLIGMYEHYTVTTGKITVNFSNESKTDGGFVGIGLFPDASVETVSTKLVENGMLRRSYIAQYTGDSKSAVQLTLPFNIAKLNSRIPNIVGDDLYRGDSASNPTEQTYLHVFAYSPTAGFVVRADVLIEYDAVFTEPRKLAQS